MDKIAEIEKEAKVKEARAEAVAELAAASAEDLAAARLLWETHREALGGFSSVTGAPLPDWDGMASNPMAQNAHLQMAKAARVHFTGTA